MEGLGFCIFGCAFIIIAIFLLVFGGSLLATIAGMISAVAFGKRWKFTNITAGLTVIGILIIPCTIGGGWLLQKVVSRPSYHLTDEEIKPFQAAIAEVDRAALGFTPISANARIEIEYASDTRPYDVMLHIYAETSRTIAFKKIGDRYKWIGEQEVHEGPNQFTTVDGTLNEYIVIDYDTEGGSGIPVNELTILYEGEDTRLNSKHFNLTLQDVQPILAEWQVIRPTPTPW